MADSFRCHLSWTGAAQGPTRDPNTFSRDLEMRFDGGPALPMSAAPAYKGDASRFNPELLLVTALSSCQALTYLFLAARAGVVVVGYEDEAEGKLALVEGRMRVAKVVLRPIIRLEEGSDEARARELIDKAHDQCFIANSVTTKVAIEPRFER
jgi:organic hydroperoxide reductase OsmC/OhrA